MIWVLRQSNYFFNCNVCTPPNDFKVLSHCKSDLTTNYFTGVLSACTAHLHFVWSKCVEFKFNYFWDLNVRFQRSTNLTFPLMLCTDDTPLHQQSVSEANKLARWHSKIIFRIFHYCWVIVQSNMNANSLCSWLILFYASFTRSFTESIAYAAINFHSQSFTFCNIT